MNASKSVKVIKESETGRNLQFENKNTGEKMSRTEFVKQIKNGNYKGYYVKKVNGIETPVSKPDDKKSNNLG